MEVWEDHMLAYPPPDQSTINATGCYEDPLFRTRKGKLGLASIIMKANMLIYIKNHG